MTVNIKGKIQMESYIQYPDRAHQMLIILSLKGEGMMVKSVLPLSLSLALPFSLSLADKIEPGGGGC